MPIIDIKLCGQKIQCGGCVSSRFPLEDFDTKIKEVGLAYLRQKNSLQQGLTWEEALLNIPDELWEKHGFHKATSDWDYLNAITMCKTADAYLIPSKEARLMEAASEMTMILMEILDPEILEQSPEGLREKISNFVLIWAPRFVDFCNGDLWGFTEKALEQSPSYDWEVIEEKEEIDPEELGCEVRFVIATRG